MASNSSLLGRKRPSYSSTVQTRLKRSVDQHDSFSDNFNYDKDSSKNKGRIYVGTSNSTSEVCPAKNSIPESIDNAGFNDGIDDDNRIFETIPYYLPCFAWLPEYTFSKLWGDIIAGISLASFQIPLALSYTTSIAHVPPLCGLYSLAISPFVYGVFGSVPQMIVGPESAISLVVGQAVESITLHKDLSLIHI